MSSYRDWHVGMKVVCVDTTRCPLLEEGHIYRIEGFDGVPGFDALFRRCEFGIYLADVDSGGFSFSPYRFRPLHKRTSDISIFRAMLTDTRTKVDA